MVVFLTPPQSVKYWDGQKLTFLPLEFLLTSTRIEFEGEVSPWDRSLGTMPVTHNIHQGSNILTVKVRNSKSTYSMAILSIENMKNHETIKKSIPARQ